MSDYHRPLGHVIFVQDCPLIYHVLIMNDDYRPLGHVIFVRNCLFIAVLGGWAIFVRALYSVLNALFRPLGPCYVLTFVLLHFL